MLTLIAGTCLLLLAPLQAPVEDTSPQKKQVDSTTVAELLKLIEENNRRYEERIRTTLTPDAARWLEHGWRGAPD